MGSRDISVDVCRQGEEKYSAYGNPKRQATAMKPFHVYLLRCADDSYYCGQTDNLETRLHQHDVGEVGYTATRKPVQLAWQGEFETRDDAIAFERQIKGWSRAKKEALIAGDWAKIQELAKSKNALRQAQGERVWEEALRQAQGERLPTSAVQTKFASVQAELVEALITPSTSSGRTGLGGSSSTSSGRTVLLESLQSSNQITQRRAVAKAITLLESTRTDHRAEADALLTQLLPHTGKALRLGISGVPGVGKSTFIEALGLFLIERGHRVAVLAIDPSSSVSGGSILGDKTRMEKLSSNERAFIRPSPSGGTLGGVTSHTREAMLVVEAAGYDVVIVETVGVGQSEVAVASMTDLFVLMQLPNAGDDLQAIKKGVMELADLVVINKVDLDSAAATRARAQITSSLRAYGRHGPSVRPEIVEGLDVASTGSARTEAGSARTGEVWQPQVIQMSALQSVGLDIFWQSVTQYQLLQTKNGQLPQRRKSQALAWMWEQVQSGLQAQFHGNPKVKVQLDTTLHAVANGSLAASTAARRLLGLVNSEGK